MTEKKSQQQLVWQCRRGLKELDVVLEPFLIQRYADLSEREQLTFARLLEEEDIDLFDWLLGNQTAEDEALADMMAQIKAFAQHA